MSASAPPEHLLVVGMARATLQPLVEQLQRCGFQVSQAASGREALELIEGESFDLVLIDIEESASDGIALLAELRQRFPSVELPIIVVASHESTAAITEAVERGANDALGRDTPDAVLRLRIRSLLDFKQTTQQLQASRTALTRLQRKLEYDLQAAAQIQQNQLPPDDLRIEGWEVAWQSVPCETLGGDSLNIIRLDDENWAFYVLDVSGHGVPASLLAVSVSRILTPGRDGSGRHDTLLPPRPLGDGRGNQESPSVASAVYVLERLQEKFIPEEDTVQYFTIVYVTLNTRTGEMRIASGGHPHPILMRSGQSPVSFSGPDGPAIGLIPPWVDIHFHEAELQLAPGDTLLLYSDGVIEAFDPQQQLFGTDRLQQCLASHASKPIKQVIQQLQAELKTWRGGQPPNDDESMLAIRRLD